VAHQRLDVEDHDLDPPCRDAPRSLVGGELIARMLELRWEESSGMYAAPLEMEANTAIFII
jgi:hypothetical protein